MQMKILGAVAIATGLVLAGCSGSNNGSSSGSTGTSSSGHTTSGSTGSTGSTGTTGTTGTTSSGTTTTSSSGGSSGTSGALCTPACTNPGETCNTYKNSANLNVHACGCTLADSSTNTPDSCAANTNGKIVCDEFTLSCRGPREYEDANTVGVYADGGGNEPCDYNGGYIPVRFCNTTIVNGVCQPTADGGPNDVQLCVGFCLSNSDCSASTFCRLDSPFTYDDGGAMTFNPGDGGQMPGSFCDLNLCGPGFAEDGGTLNSDYLATCDAHGTQDGTCLPVLANGYALCSYAKSDAGAFANCDSALFSATTENGCGADATCIPGSLIGGATAPSQNAYCLPMCNSFADGGANQAYPVLCPSIGGQQATCYGFTNDVIADGGLNPGVCL